MKFEESGGAPSNSFDPSIGLFDACPSNSSFTNRDTQTNMVAIEWEREVELAKNSEFRPQGWMRLCLLAAGLLHGMAGLAALLFPTATLSALVGDCDGLEIVLWQCIGGWVGWMGIGYWVASRNVYDHRFFLQLAVVQQAMLSAFGTWLLLKDWIPISLFWTSLVFGVIWTIPTILMVWKAIRASHACGSAYVEPEADEPLRDLRTQTGQLLDELADDRPQLVVFLRHAGCTFCRQALADVQAVREQIEETGCGIVFVHLGTENDRESIEVFTKYGVDDLPRISDPSCRLYRQFGLDLGGFPELFGLRVWFRGFLYGVMNGHGIGAVRGNSFQMPGVYLYHCGMVLGGFRHDTAADRPDYLGLAKQVSVQAEAVRSLEPSASAT